VAEDVNGADVGIEVGVRIGTGVGDGVEGGVCVMPAQPATKTIIHRDKRLLKSRAFIWVTIVLTIASLRVGRV